MAGLGAESTAEAAEGGVRGRCRRKRFFAWRVSSRRRSLGGSEGAKPRDTRAPRRKPSQYFSDGAEELRVWRGAATRVVGRMGGERPPISTASQAQPDKRKAVGGRGARPVWGSWSKQPASGSAGFAPFILAGRGCRSLRMRASPWGSYLPPDYSEARTTRGNALGKVR